jgi:hypothetical protein
MACVTALALAAATLGGSRHETSSSGRFGAEAVRWLAARYAAGHACVANLVRFFDEHVVVDDRVAGRVTAGRATFLRRYARFAMDRGTGTCDPAEPTALLLSADEILDQFHYPAHVPWAPGVDHGVVVGTVGPRGYTHVMVAASMEHWRTEAPALPLLDRLEHLAGRYVALWNGRRGVDAADVYADGASVVDTLQGFSVHGLKDLRAVVGSGEWPDLPDLTIAAPPDRPGGGWPPSPPPHERAVFVGPAVPGTAASDELILLLRADDGSGCPGVVGAALALSRGRIISERRYHAVGSVRRCLDTSTLRRGWWEGIGVPEPTVRRRTGTVTWPHPSRIVEVYNGTRATDEYVRWGLQRFADAGLVVPTVDSVTFVLDQGRCPLGRGFAWYDVSGADVALCFPPDRVCGDADCSHGTTDAGRTLLHEYAHAWLAQNVTESTRQAFMRRVGVARWQDPRDPWGRRGVERAADTVMLGLTNEPSAMPPAACRALAARFRLLAGIPPLAPCAGRVGGGP